MKVFGKEVTLKENSEILEKSLAELVGKQQQECQESMKTRIKHFEQYIGKK
jgi:hypothetical protein